MLRKRYIHKIYSLDGTFLRTLDPKLVMNEVAFTEKTSGGQGQCNLELNVRLDDFSEGTIIAHMNVVQIYEQDDRFSQAPRLIYTGFVSQYTPYVTGSNEGVSVTLLGLVSLLSLSFYHPGSYTFEQTASAGDLFTFIVDDYNSVYPGAWIGHDGGHVDTSSAVVTFGFNNNKWLDALKRIGELSDPGWWWRVGADGQVYLQPRPSVATHLLTIGRDVEEIRITKNNEKIVNQYTLTYGAPPSTVVYSDLTSQGLYGLRDKMETDVNTKDATSANQKGNKLIADFKDPKVETTVRLNNNFDIEGIHPGDTVTIGNTKRGSNVLPPNLLVTSISYTTNNVTLTLENELASLADTFVDAVGDIT